MTNTALHAVNGLQAKISSPPNEAALTAAVNAAPIGYILVGPQRRVFQCAGSMIEEIGLSPDKAIGEPIERLFPDSPKVLAAVGGAYRGEIVDKTVAIGGGTYAFRIFPISDGEVTEFVAIVASKSHLRADAGEMFPIDLLDLVSEGVVTADRNGLILSLSRPAERIFGCSAHTVLGKRLGTVLPDIAIDEALLPVTKNSVVHRRDGSSVPVNVSTSVSHENGDEVIVAIVTDLTEREAAQRALAESDARYALVAAGANDGLWEWNLEDGTVQFSERWRTLLGLEKATIKHTPEEWLSRIHPDDVDTFCDRFDSHLEGKTSQFEHEYRMRHANGKFRWVQARGIVARRENGEPFLMAGSQSDITDRKVAEEGLTHGALHDALTGLPNRTLVLDRVNQSLARMAHNEDKNFALAILDLDRFMIVNESLGHAVGDELLVSLARRLETRMAPGNTLARLGGDEFAVLLEEFETVDEVRRSVKRLQDVISQPFDIDGQEIFVSASIGIAFGTSRYKRAEEVLRDADLAMYRGKKEGKSGFEVFEESRHRGTVDILQVETSLRRALENDGVLVYYQPIVDLKKGCVTGFEALARMSHPTRGIVPPGEFIGIAEDTGLIVPLGERVLEMACTAASAWQQRFGLKNRLSMSVNLSARHLAQENIVSLLENVLARSKLPPEDLKIEITETLIMTNPELAAQTLSRVKELGVTLSLDDFGTGYSSLSYLRRFPIDTLKMDRSFVGRMDTDERDMELVRMIILLAHTLGMEVVGEGIESESQLGLLRELNCEFGQGYFFARPLTEAAAVELLSAPQTWC